MSTIPVQPNLPMVPMYLHPDLYEVSYDGALPDELPFLLKILGRRIPAQGRVLELAAGSGRISVPLARAGYRVLAIDREPEMIEQLRRNADHHKVTIDCMEADMRSFNTEVQYDAIISMLGVVSLVTSFDDFVRVLRCTANSLRTGGICLLVLVAAEDPADVTPHDSYWAGGNGAIRTQSWFSYEQTNESDDSAVVAYQYRIYAMKNSEPGKFLCDDGLLRIVSTEFLVRAATEAGLEFECWHPMFDAENSFQTIPDKSGAAVALLTRS